MLTPCVHTRCAVLRASPWLQPDHPDPKGEWLALIATALKSVLAPSKNRKNVVGMLWDFPSLYQHPRTDEQTELFKQALGNLAAFYSHQYTMVFRLTKFPEGYPRGYKLPKGANVAEYPNRGW